MKKILTSVLLLFIGVMSAQTDEKKNSDPEYKAEKIIYSESGDTLHLVGNVDFETEFLKFENAEEVVWNRKSNEIIVRGIKDFEVDGSVMFSDNPDSQTLRYKLGSKIARFD